MSVERMGGHVAFACDTCSELIETDQREFNPALAEAKSAGWIAYPVAGLWCHRCPSCREDRR